ncbi:hypothetical protein M8C21_021869 [Ambrosia artemisiifolia]|uniref:Uncharacterized protein n=1 Tax=Ambrosia artemisiifolia TaxID=4212 RepID=A0AAD5GEC9_AMBAR|nr:hypothetical protein M8C21_021869 [Ambrosia artemisiifolia]
MVGGDGERVEDSKDLQQQRKALHKLTDHVDDRQLHFTRVQEAMASIAAFKEADLNAMRFRWHQLILLKHSGFLPHFIKIETMFETQIRSHFFNQPRMGAWTRERYEGAEYIPPWLLASHWLQWRSCTGVHGFNISPALLVRFLLTNVFSIDVGSNVLDYRIHPSIVNSIYVLRFCVIFWTVAVTVVLGDCILRFHQLPERSCRSRLAGHNERRRKPTSGTFLYSRYGSLPSSIFGQISIALAQQGVFTGLAQEIHLLPLRNYRYCHGMAE